MKDIYTSFLFHDNPEQAPKTTDANYYINIMFIWRYLPNNASSEMLYQILSWENALRIFLSLCLLKNYLFAHYPKLIMNSVCSFMINMSKFAENDVLVMALLLYLNNTLSVPVINFLTKAAFIPYGSL